MNKNLFLLICATAVASSSFGMDRFNDSYNTFEVNQIVPYNEKPYLVIEKSCIDIDNDLKQGSIKTIVLRRKVIPYIMDRHVRLTLDETMPKRDAAVAKINSATVRDETYVKYSRFSKVLGIGAVAATLYGAYCLGKYSSDYLTSLADYLFPGKK